MGLFYFSEIDSAFFVGFRKFYGSYGFGVFVAFRVEGLGI